MKSKFRVVLTAPEEARNIGFVARAIQSFGAIELVIAKHDWTQIPDPAFITGCMAKEVLNSARICKTLEEAIEGCATAIAFSRRDLQLGQRELTLPNTSSEWFDNDLPVALVFGRESSGLTREEAVLCPWLGRIKMSKDTTSLNLGQAVSVVLYELTQSNFDLERTVQNKTLSSSSAKKSAPLSQQKAMVEFLNSQLMGKPGFYQTRLEQMEQFIYQMGLSEDQLALWFKVVKELADPKSGRKGQKTK